MEYHLTQHENRQTHHPYRTNKTGCHTSKDIQAGNTKGPFLLFILILFYLRRCFNILPLVIT